MGASPAPAVITVRNFPNELQAFLKADKGNKDLFEATWKIVQECGEEERHFNQLQSVYRGLVSTWLLATFAAVGYLFKEGQDEPFFLAAVVCLASTWGIRLIWMLDLGVYHQLLVAVFKEGKKAEDCFAWLPGFRINMYGAGRQKPEQRDPVFRNLSWYYLGTILVPIAGGIVLSVLAWQHGVHWRADLLLAGFVALSALAIARFYRTTKRKEQA